MKTKMVSGKKKKNWCSMYRQQDPFRRLGSPEENKNEVPVDESRDEGEERFRRRRNERETRKAPYILSFIRWRTNERANEIESAQVLKSWITSSEHHQNTGWKRTQRDMYTEAHTFRDRVLSAETGCKLWMRMRNWCRKKRSKSRTKFTRHRIFGLGKELWSNWRPLTSYPTNYNLLEPEYLN